MLLRNTPEFVHHAVLYKKLQKLYQVTLLCGASARFAVLLGLFVRPGKQRVSNAQTVFSHGQYKLRTRAHGVWRQRLQHEPKHGEVAGRFCRVFCYNCKQELFCTTAHGF